MECPGFAENEILPLLLSNLSTTEMLLMVLVEKNNAGIVYKSRNCGRTGDNSVCDQCQKMFNNISHFHHLYLSQSCKQYLGSTLKLGNENNSKLVEVEGKLETEKFEKEARVNDESSELLNKLESQPDINDHFKESTSEDHNLFLEIEENKTDRSTRCD